MYLCIRALQRWKGGVNSCCDALSGIVREKENEKKNTYSERRQARTSDSRKGEVNGNRPFYLVLMSTFSHTAVRSVDFRSLPTSRQKPTGILGQTVTLSEREKTAHTKKKKRRRLRFHSFPFKRIQCPPCVPLSRRRSVTCASRRNGSTEVRGWFLWTLSKDHTHTHSNKKPSFKWKRGCDVICSCCISLQISLCRSAVN